MRMCSNFLIRLSPRCKNYASKSNEIKNRIKSKHPAMKFLKIYLSRSIIKTPYIYFDISVRNISIIIFSFVRVFVYSFLANSNFRYTSKIEIDEQFT